MKASVMDLRYNMTAILKALDKNESVTIFYHGKPRGLLIPFQQANNSSKQQPTIQTILAHQAFGMWADDTEKKNIEKYIRKIRKPRVKRLRGKRAF